MDASRLGAMDEKRGGIDQPPIRADNSVARRLRGIATTNHGLAVHAVLHGWPTLTEILPAATSSGNPEREGQEGDATPCRQHTPQQERSHIGGRSWPQINPEDPYLLGVRLLRAQFLPWRKR